MDPDIYIRIYQESDNSLKLTDLFIQFPIPNKVSVAQNSLELVLSENKKSVIQILRQKSGTFVIVTNRQAQINNYLFIKEDRRYVTVKIKKAVQDKERIYWVTFVAPSITLEEKKQMLTLDQQSNQLEAENAVVTILNNSVKYFDFAILKQNVKITVQTQKNKNIIPFIFQGTLQQFQKAEGKIMKIWCKIFTHLIIQHESEFNLQIAINQKIKQVLERISNIELTISSKNYQIMSENGQISVQTEIYKIYKGDKYINLFLKKKKTYDFLAFDQPLESSKVIDEYFIMQFAAFYGKQKHFRMLIKSEIKDQFCHEWRKLTIDCLKRGFQGRTAMQILSFQQNLAQQINEFSLWNNTKLDKTFINIYLLERANNFGKILLGDMLQDNYSLPTHVIYRQQRKLKILQQNIFLTESGLTLASIEISPRNNKQQSNGKSTLLNNLFYTNFVLKQNRHQSIKSIPFMAHEIFKDDFPFHVIDIPKNVDPQEQQRLLNGANIILLNSWENQQITKQKARKLSLKFNCYVLILYRDKQTSTTSSMNFSYDLKHQDQNYLQIFDISKNLGSKLNIDIIRKEIGKFILQVSKRLTIDDYNKVYKIYKDSEYYESYIKFLLYLNNIKENITTMKTQKDKPVHPYFAKILEFIFDRQKLQDQKKFAYVFINFLKRMKSYAEKPYLNLYKIKSQLQKKLDQFKILTNQNIFKIFISKSNDQLRKIFGFPLNQNLLNFQLQPLENLNLLKKKILEVEKSIVPNIFSSEIAMRQLLIAKQDSLENRNLKDIYVSLNTMEIRRGAAFQIIDGDNLDMPLQSIKRSLNFVKDSVVVVSVLGPQSSGKSTLLNFLFGCNFRASEGRCTKGVYGSYYQMNSGQSIMANGILIIDTQGINSQSKSKQFDRKLVSFIMSISDILIITMKGDIDKAIGDLLVLCYRHTKERFYNPNLQIFLVLNQNNTNDITRNDKQINDFKQKMLTTNQVQLSRAFSNFSINSTNLPFLSDKKDFMKLAPLNSFMEQIINLQSLILQKINKIKQYSNMSNKLQIFSRNWETVRTFSKIYNYDSIEEIQFVAHMDQWIAHKTNILKGDQEKILDELKQNKSSIKDAQDKQNKLRQTLKQQCKIQMNETITQLIKKYEKQIKNPTIKKLELQQLVRQKQTKQYNKFIDDFQNIFKGKIKIMQNNKKIKDVESQGIEQINSKAYQMRNKQLDQKNSMSNKDLNQQFEKVWDKSVQRFKQNSDTKRSFQILTELLMKQYNVEKEKYISQQSDQSKKSMLNKQMQIQSNFEGLPTKINSITRQNIFDQNKIDQIFEQIFKNKKQYFLEAINKDPIFIYQKNIGVITAKKKYLNIEQTFLTQSKIEYTIGIQKQRLKLVFSRQFLVQLIYKGLLIKINKQLEKYGLQIVGLNKFKEAINYQQNNSILKMINVVPQIQLKFLFQTKISQISQQFQFINKNNIQKIKQEKPKNLKAEKILNLKNIKYYLQSNQSIQYAQKLINLQLNLINLKIKLQKNKQNFNININTNSDIQIKYISSKFFHQKISQMKLLMNQIINLVKQDQNIPPKSYHIVGTYQVQKYIADSRKNFPKQVQKYFNIYVSQENKAKITMIKQESINISKKLDLTKEIINLIKNQVKKILKSSKDSEIIYNFVFLIQNQFKIFDQDLLQLSLKSTIILKGYCHLYALYFLISNRMQNQRKGYHELVQNYQKLKESQRIQFLNRASANQQTNSKQSFINFINNIQKHFNKRTKQIATAMVENFKNNTLNILKSENIIKREDLIAEVLESLIQDQQLEKNQQSRKNKQHQIIKFMKNKYQKLEKYKQQLLIKKANSYNQIGKLIADISDEISYHIQALIKLREVIKNIQNQVIKKQESFYDQKNFFKFKKQHQNTGARLYQYFLILVSTALQAEYKEKIKNLSQYQLKEGIFEDYQIRIKEVNFNKRPKQIAKEIILYLKEPQIHEQISNLYYFFKQTSNYSSFLLKQEQEEVQKQLKNKKEQAQSLYKRKIDINFCSQKSLCPCCQQICFLQGQHPTHEASYHQTRGWGKTVVTREGDINKSYLSTLLCEQIDDNDPMFFNNVQNTWKQYKQQQKFWKFPETKSLNQKRKQQMDKIWNTYGHLFAKQTNIQYRNTTTFSNYHLIFIIDESGSMKTNWNKMGQFYNKIVHMINSNPKQIFKLSQQNTRFSQILFNQNARLTYSQKKSSQIGKFPEMKSGNTSYLPAFRILKEDVLNKETLIYSTNIFFLTDGQNQDQRAFNNFASNQLKELLNQKKINLVAIFFGDNPNIFYETFSKIQCKTYVAANISSVDSIVRGEIEALTSK